MPDPTLLEIIEKRFDVRVDRDSDGGQILNSLTPILPFDAPTLEGQANVGPLSFVPNGSGVSVRAAENNDAVVISVPAGPFVFTVIPPDAAHPDLQVELNLTPIQVPLPFLHAAQVTPQGALAEGTGDVTLNLPDLLLVITASVRTPASARLASALNAPDDIPVTMSPPFASLDEDRVIGFGFAAAIFKTGGEPEILMSKVDIFIAPPGIPALAMSGEAENLHIGLGAGSGVTGDLKIAPAAGTASARPRFLRNVGARLRLNRSAVTLLELKGQIAIGEEVHTHFSALDGQAANINYTLGLALDNGWQAALTLTAGGDHNYLWRTEGTSAGLQELARNTLGAYAVFAPILQSDWASGVAAVAGSPFIHTQSITLYGGELQVNELPDGSFIGKLFFDLETEMKLGGGTTGVMLESRRNIKVRHKAIGVKLDFGPNGDSPQLEPFVDPAQGFGLDLSDPGMFAVPPLDDIFKPDMGIYRNASLIYAIRPPIDLQDAIAAIAREVKADLIIRPFGNEKADLIKYFKEYSLVNYQKARFYLYRS